MADRTRSHIYLEAEDRALIEALQQGRANNLSDLVRKSLRLYARVKDAENAGGQIKLHLPDGTIERLWLLT